MPPQLRAARPPLFRAGAQGLDGLTSLTSLSLGNVGLTTLDGFPAAPQLKTLNLSDNKVTSGLSALTKEKLPVLEKARPGSLDACRQPHRRALCCAAGTSPSAVPWKRQFNSEPPE